MLSKSLIFLALLAVLISAQSRYDRRRTDDRRRADEIRRQEEEQRRYEEALRRYEEEQQRLYDEDQRRIHEEEQQERYEVEQQRKQHEEHQRRLALEEQRRQQEEQRRLAESRRRVQESRRRPPVSAAADPGRRRPGASAALVVDPGRRRTDHASVAVDPDRRRVDATSARMRAEATKRRDDYDITNDPEIRSPNWMSYLEHHRSIATLSIPGTHSSMSFSGGVENQRQSWPLYKQYEAGIRFVDIRCRHYRNNLYVYHGKGSARHTLDAIFRETIKYLDKYPSEVILMRIRREGIPSYNRETMGDTMRRMLVKYPNNRIWSSSRVPTLQDTRGRIVILQDFYSNFHIGVNYRFLNIEDSGNVRNANAFTWKWDRVRQHLQTAQRGNPTNMYITYTGGAGSGLDPHAVANRVNKYLWDHLSNTPGRHRFGIVAMDFPGARLVKKIIDSNY